MKPVENVSIGGCVFKFEIDACSAAREYLDELENFYSRKKSGAEVMEGIEERMSELLMEQSGQDGVITLPMVQRVIGTLGRPEAIEEESQGDPDSSSDSPAGTDSRHSRSGKESSAEGKTRRKLYRDPPNATLAGVCSGLGIFLNIDPTVFRLLFVILSLLGLRFFFRHGYHRFGDFTVPVIYLILWVCMPVAKTVRQRDELRGEKGTVDAISAKIQSAADEMGEAAEKITRAENWRPVWRGLEFVIGIVFLIVGIAGVVVLGTTFGAIDLFESGFFYNKLIEEIASNAPMVLDYLSYPPALFSLAVVIVMPFIGLIYSGVMMTFDLKASKWHPGLWILVIWLIAVTVFAVLTAIYALQAL